MSYYNPEHWRKPEDRIWALKKAAEPSGFMPNGDSSAQFLTTMELENLVRRSNVAPVWFITDAGRAELFRLETALANTPIGFDDASGEK